MLALIHLWCLALDILRRVCVCLCFSINNNSRRLWIRLSVLHVRLSLSRSLKLSPGSEDDYEGPVSEKLGRIQFSLGYSFQDTTLTVKILKGQDLPAKDFSGTSDPFVKIYLLPDRKHKLETKIKRKNLNPHWNETFLFEGQFLVKTILVNNLLLLFFPWQ